MPIASTDEHIAFTASSVEITNPDALGVGAESVIWQFGEKSEPIGKRHIEHLVANRLICP